MFKLLARAIAVGRRTNGRATDSDHTSVGGRASGGRTPEWGRGSIMGLTSELNSLLKIANILSPSGIIL